MIGAKRTRRMGAAQSGRRVAQSTLMHNRVASPTLIGTHEATLVRSRSPPVSRPSPAMPALFHVSTATCRSHRRGCKCSSLTFVCAGCRSAWRWVFHGGRRERRCVSVGGCGLHRAHVWHC